ncbi:MAG: 50S ribosomal protein L25/general stress protein Ctc [Bifidobacteriaceae bacterium]|nr:50S ribosomal protein L25/general stress protein Ctc [Aeriscardovia sp.]MEE1324806.1 50S ribosomal protein L25/general stress protein Ctc [Bifidobacteriaceae bacterium]
MAEHIELAGDVRTKFGKGAARQLRREHKIPASLYSHGKQPLFLELPMHETSNALRHTNAIFELDFGGENHLAVVKDVQKNPVKRIIEHIDFYEVKAGDKIEVEVPVFIEGETKGNGVAFILTKTLRVLADVSNLPEEFTLSVEGKQAGDEILAKDIKLPKGAKLVDIDEDTVIVSVQVPEGEEEPAATAADASDGKSDAAK